MITNISSSFPEESNLIKAQDASPDSTPHEALSNTKQNIQLQPCPLPNCPFQHTATSLMLKVNTNDLIDLSQPKSEEMIDCFPTIFAHKIPINNYFFKRFSIIRSLQKPLSNPTRQSQYSLSMYTCPKSTGWSIISPPCQKLLVYISFVYLPFNSHE